MKKLIASAIAALFVVAAFQSQAQTSASSRSEKKEIKSEKHETRKELRKLEGNEVSIRAKDAFESDFGNVAGVQWERGKQFDEATFIKDGQRTKAYYDCDSRLVGTTSDKKFSDLPANAQKEIQKKYKGFVTGAVIMFDDNEANETNMMLFGSEFEDADNYFVGVSKGNHENVLKVSMTGAVSYFEQAH